MKHNNIAFFIPHQGCPHQCSFCNQHSISEAVAPAPSEVHETCAKALMFVKASENTEIAFFGGSFTAIDHAYMIALLEAAQPFIEEGKFYGIRISTRPDAINDDILRLLQKYHVTSVELGVQSLNQRVLDLNNRGHTVADINRAISLIKAYGFSLGLQMMVGLYGDDKESLYQTVQKIIDCQPDSVRIYPTVILKGTYLAQLFQNGAYTPMTLQEAVDCCSDILRQFTAKNITVIRLGLHAGHGIEQNMLGGVYHPAFRELCENKIYYDQAFSLIKQQNFKKIILFVKKGALSKMIGQKRMNIIKLNEQGYQCKVKEKENLEEFAVEIKEDVSS